LSWDQFAAFNAHYVALLHANGFCTDSAFPVGRSNVAPLVDPPAENTLFAFTYAQPSDRVSSRDFMISGNAESTGTGHSNAADDVSPQSMASKARDVIKQLRFRVQALGCRWADITGAQASTIHSLDPVMDELACSRLGQVGLSLFLAYPPVIGLEFEVDVRAVSWEHTA